MRSLTDARRKRDEEIGRSGRCAALARGLSWPGAMAGTEASQWKGVAHGRVETAHRRPAGVGSERSTGGGPLQLTRASQTSGRAGFGPLD